MVSSISLVGTTSGGKSTIGNLLSGHYLLPAGVQETTTSVIEICHDTQTRTREFLFSDAERRPLCEARFSSNDAVVRHCIQEAMARADSSPEHISVRVRLRTRASSILRRLTGRACGPPVLHGMGIQNGFQIRDFPGFQHSGDTRSLQKLEGSFDDRGMMIYTFNAEETDDTKEDQLLGAILALLRRRRRNWRSILFVLNRIDAFRRDLDPTDSLQRALTKRQARIRRLISENWGPAQPKDSPAIVALAAGPVFAAEMLCYRHGSVCADRELFEYQVTNSAYPLLPRHIQDLLPRSPSRWTKRQWRIARGSLRATSGLDAFMTVLAAQARRLRAEMDRL
jgi:hypothetical protein